jgi:hypothetical protein
LLAQFDSDSGLKKNRKHRKWNRTASIAMEERALPVARRRKR